MSAQGMTTTLLAGKLAEAVAKDETPEAGGCDISAGLFGPHASDWIRSIAAVVDAGQKLEEAARMVQAGEMPAQSIQVERSAFRAALESLQ